MKRIVAIVLALGITCGCALHRRESIPPRIKRVEVGWASWYGKDFHGRRTASGAVYDMYQLTAAHQTLPLGTSVMVTHLDSGKSVMVTVNDRGPFVKGRIIDLSYAAAQALGMVEEGVARVRLEVVDKKAAPISPPEGPLTIQVGAFIDRSNAVRLMADLQKTYTDVTITELKTPENTYYRVRVGRFRTREEAYQIASRLAQEGYTAFMTRTE
jgi:peptidoglycan lytic transglycosylase